MAKQKTGPWSPEECDELYIPKDENTVKLLKKASKKLNRPYANVYAKWNALRKNAEKSKGKKMKARVIIPLTLVSKEGDIPAMEFKVEKGDITSKVTSIEKLSMMKGLDLIVPTVIVGIRKGAILMNNSVKNAALAYLHTKFPAQKFGSTPVLDTKTGKPTSESRIFRKL